MQTILGSGGSIGIDLAKSLTQYTKDIRLVSRNPQKVNATDQILAADLSNAEEVDRAIKGSEVVYVTIGFPYSKKVWKQKWPPFINNVITACKKYEAKLVFFDNIYMYDPDYLENITEETPIRPVSEKGKVRAIIAQQIMDEVNNGSLTALIARAPDFYMGENSLMKIMAYDNLIKDKKVFWIGDPDNIHSFIYTPDAARATAILGNSPEAYNQVWHLPTTKEKLTSRDWINLVAKELGTEAKISKMPNWMMSLIGVFVPAVSELKEMAYQLETDYFFNSIKFEKAYKYDPIAPEEGIRACIENYREMEGK